MIMIQSSTDFERQLIAEQTARMLIEVGAVLFNAEQPFIFTSGWASPVPVPYTHLGLYKRQGQ